MAHNKRLDPTPELLETIVTRIPEGFISDKALKKRIKLSKVHRAHYIKAIESSKAVGRQGQFIYDASRLTADEVKTLRGWCDPILPRIRANLPLNGMTITEQHDLRNQQIQDSGETIVVGFFEILNQSRGYVEVEALCQDIPDAPEKLQQLIDGEILHQANGLIFDPLRLGERSIKQILKERDLIPKRQAICDYLDTQEGYVASRDALYKQFGEEMVNKVTNSGGFSVFNVPTQSAHKPNIWVCSKDVDYQKARELAIEAVKITDDEWQPALELAGDVLRDDATSEGNTYRAQVIARSYTLQRAAKRLHIKKGTLEQALRQNIIISFTDPLDSTRIPAYLVENALADSTYYNAISGLERVQVRDIAIVCGITYSAAYKRLKRINIHSMTPQWQEVKGRWKLPDSLAEFKQLRDAAVQAWKEEQARRREEEERRLKEALEAERKRRNELRQRLVEAFPTWQHEYRGKQQIQLHIGPPNSGKTHDALQRLSNAGNGWYLAPLRLLAFEIFDRLNKSGVLCSLLTGEERIDVPGSTVTAATIEMFNAEQSGDVVIIDEAQMLADSDRGWAWTQALMQVRAEEIHVIGPATISNLVEKMAQAAAVPVHITEHQRLAPIEVATKPWSLDTLPDHTILVAFSRKMVLDLKAKLEERGRQVSVIYGNLPPEVRRKQADRFANGETEICVATDAVGMGLNLPADNVCFYDIEKFDGQTVRLLKGDEVKQIGGRAGRFGLSQGGVIGAIRQEDLEILQELFYEDPEEIEFARVAPSVKDLELLPGSLGEKLEQWAVLQSIPESLKDIVKVGNLAERVELAKMLTDEEVNQLGLDGAVKLTNAPTRQSSRQFWYQCAQAILAGTPQPLPPEAPSQIASSRDLEKMEISIACADVYLWLASRKEFSTSAPDEQAIREARVHWSQQIDDALLNQLDTSRRCEQCGRPLHLRHRHRLCDKCFGRKHHRRRYRRK